MHLLFAYVSLQRIIKCISVSIHIHGRHRLTPSHPRWITHSYITLPPFPWERRTSSKPSSSSTFTTSMSSSSLRLVPLQPTHRLLRSLTHLFCLHMDAGSHDGQQQLCGHKDEECSVIVGSPAPPRCSGRFSVVNERNEKMH
jgi:hypothetical protein